jgi:undecaprenyl-diphosphatase
MLFRIPRPWVKDPSFTIVESAREAASGYSFPSGHTQTSVGLFGAIANTTKIKAVRAVSIALIILVPISRMYLGVHTPADVLVSVAIALLLVFALRPLFKKAESSPKLMITLLSSMFVVSVAYLLFITTHNFPIDVYYTTNVHNLISARENAFTLVGCIAGLVVVYVIDTVWIKFETKASLPAQILKILGGIILVVAVKELLRSPLTALFGDYVGRSIRYFLMVIVAGAVWPLTFKLFSRLGRK